MFLFYAPDTGMGDGLCRFPASESFHCAKVLRMKPGQGVQVTDGRGHLYEAELSLVDERHCAARILRCLKKPGDAGNQEPLVHIILAPTKNMERTEWFLEKATEIGLGRVSFVQCARSERKTVKMERLEAILVSAMKQSLHIYLPRMDAMCSLEEFLRRSDEAETRNEIVGTRDEADRDRNEESGEKESPDSQTVQKFIAYCGPEYEKKDYLSLLRPGTGSRVLIGPEGDFTPEEVENCVRHGYIPVSLGTSRLRTETAALFAAWGPAFAEGLKA